MPDVRTEVTPGPSTPGRWDDTVSALRAAGCVFAEDEARLLLAAASTPAELAALVTRRVGGEPLEHLLGWAEFCGLRVAVDPGVFVPRRRSELLVREALTLLPPPGTDTGGRPVVVDLCCGSGAVGAALLAARRDVTLVAADVDPAAVRCARRTLERAGGRVLGGDLFDALPRDLLGRVHVLVANAPYVPTDAIALMPPEARAHEPAAALDGGADGLAVVRRVVAGAPEWLVPGGHVLVESSERQAADVAAAMAARGLTARVVRSEDLDATAVVGTAADGAAPAAAEAGPGRRGTSS